MRAKDLIKKLQKKPELFVKVAETKKHSDKAPTMEIIDCHIAELEDAEETVFLLWIEPNPYTIRIPAVYKKAAKKTGSPAKPKPVKERKCRVCGCTDNDCSQCIEKTGHPCHWIAADLCSACEEEARNLIN